VSQAGVPPPTDAVEVRNKKSIDDQPREPLRGLPGVQHKVLWRSGGMIIGIVRLEPGAEEPGHAHHDAAQHVDVLQGQRVDCWPDDRGRGLRLRAGRGHPRHHRRGPGGCTLFYTHPPGHWADLRPWVPSSPTRPKVGWAKRPLLCVAFLPVGSIRLAETDCELHLRLAPSAAGRATPR